MSDSDDSPTLLAAARALLTRWGGILVRPRTTIAALQAAPAQTGKWDGWLLVALFVLGSQVERLVEMVERFRVFRSFLLLFNGVAMALLIPVLVWLVIEGVVGPPRARFRHLPLAPLVLCATIGNLLRQAGVGWTGPVYLPEMLGAAWAIALAVWIRAKVPGEAEASVQA